LDYKIYYEFLDVASLHNPQNAIPLEDVKCGISYAIIISTCGGLWRYMIGDTITFTSLSPYRIKITGRTKHFINIAGEEIIIDNADKAIKAACTATSAHVTDYTAAPIYMDGKNKGAHEWIFEFETAPTSVAIFTDVLDKTLQDINSDYLVKRTGGALGAPLLHIAPQNTFYQWMKNRGKLGGQNKIPRLSNNRTYIDPLLELIKTTTCI
ncbi:MAG: GH3 auxin-responsive promoter family protein, partial [Rikenellaceae bacterium]